MSIQSVKGTRDFYPTELAFRNWLSEHIRNVSQLYGYEEWDGPLLEPFELYAAKSGDELVNEQAFVLGDRGGRKIVLRPELTPSLARMVAQKQHELIKPLRWFSIGPMWRYEQPQRGRAREFWQWNIDMLGPDSSQADAELIAIAIQFLQSLGLNEKDFVIKINDRQWFEKKLADLGIDSSHNSIVMRAVDRIDKMEEQAWKDYLTEQGINKGHVDDLYKTITQKHESLDSIHPNENLLTIVETLKTMGLVDYIAIDATVVRGLDYYTSTVFEIRDREGKLRAIGGGGRYANLVEQVGGQPLSGVGFAMGDMPLEELLRDANKYPKDIVIKPKVLVTVFSKETSVKSLELANSLRQENVPTELYVASKESDYNLNKQLKCADKRGIHYVLILGPDEIKNNEVTVKNLDNGEQQKLKTEALLDFLDK